MEEESTRITFDGTQLVKEADDQRTLGTSATSRSTALIYFANRTRQTVKAPQTAFGNSLVSISEHSAVVGYLWNLNFLSRSVAQESRSALPV